VSSRPILRLPSEIAIADIVAAANELAKGQMLRDRQR